MPVSQMKKYEVKFVSVTNLVARERKDNRDEVAEWQY
jgi:hypothetical protein